MMINDFNEMCIFEIEAINEQLGIEVVINDGKIVDVTKSITEE